MHLACASVSRTSSSSKGNANSRARRLQLALVLSSPAADAPTHQATDRFWPSTVGQIAITEVGQLITPNWAS